MFDLLERPRAPGHARATGLSAVLSAVLAAVLAAVLVLAAVPAVHGQEVELRWQFQEGEELTYRQTQNSRSTSGMGSMTQTQEILMRQEVLRVGEDGAADLRVTYEAFRSVQEGPMGRQEFDSRSGAEPEDPGMAMMGALVGSSFEMTMGPRGEVRSVSGLDALMDRMLEEMTADSPEAAGQVRGMMEGMFGEEAMEAMLQQGMHMLPAGPVRPDATWSHELELALPFGTVDSAYEYRLEDVVDEGGRRIAKLGLTGSIGGFEPAEGNPMAGMMDVSGADTRGTVDFDVDRGRLLRSSATTVLTTSAMGQEVEVESTQEMELVEG